VLKRPRFVRRGHELGYLLRALRNTFYSRHRTATRRPRTVTLPEDAAYAIPEPESAQARSFRRSPARPLCTETR
jgi:DNA-directed RNA polymerase specialized sigma24 family protein